MLEHSEIQTTDSAQWLRPPDVVIAAHLRGRKPGDVSEDFPSEVFTPGLTRWPADADARLRLADPARQEANRRRLLEALATPGPLWDLAHHPELEGGSAAWVEKLRRESEEAFEKRTRGGNNG